MGKCRYINPGLLKYSSEFFSIKLNTGKTLSSEQGKWLPWTMGSVLMAGAAGAI
jgi:hypothetical protein